MEDGRFSRRRKYRKVVRERPGLVPSALFHIIGNTVFLRLADVASGLPVCGPSVELRVATTSVAVRIDTPITVTAEFDEAVSGFTLGDVVVANGAASNFSGSGTVYTFDVLPNAIGTVTVDIHAGVAEGADGDGNEGAERLWLGMPYDDDGDSVIDGEEVIYAVVDFFNDSITPTQVLEVVRLYFSS